MENTLNKKVLNLQDSIITEFAQLANEIPNCIRLTYGEPNYSTPEIIKNACKIAIDNNRTKYEQTNGNTYLIEEIIKYQKIQNNYDYTKHEVLITNGATGAIFIALSTILNPNDEVIIPSPYYPEYIPVVNNCNSKVVIYNNKPYNYQLDYHSLENLITKKTKCLILTSPNNPTGISLNKDSIDNAYKLIKKYNIFLLLDNCYEKIIFDNSNNFSLYKDLKENLLICNSFSKTYSMTGWRLGYLLAAEFIIRNASKLHQYLNVSVTTFVQDAGISALKYNPKKEIKVLKKNMEYAYNRLIDMNIDVIKPSGAFFLFPSIKKYNIDSYTFCKRLLFEESVAIIPGIAFGEDDNIRISFCVDHLVLIEALNRLERFIKKLEKELSN